MSTRCVMRQGSRPRALRTSACARHDDAGNYGNNARAARYDAELDDDMATITRTLHRLDLERMAVDAETFSAALERDLIAPADFAP